VINKKYAYCLQLGVDSLLLAVVCAVEWAVVWRMNGYKELGLVRYLLHRKHS